METGSYLEDVDISGLPDDGEITIRRSQLFFE
jgi:hypothetical protein